jgi:hypothetical protein
VKINGSVQTLGSGYGTAGVHIFPDEEMIGFMYGGGGIFPLGVGNIEVQYTAGYDGVPEDLEIACSQAVALNYKRKATQDLKSKSTGGSGVSGTTAYRDWKLTPMIEAVLDS